jgi:predicted CoA-substrate-specific enzyme activase
MERTGSVHPRAERFVGIDAGAETLKLVEIVADEDGFRLLRREMLEHSKRPGPALVEALASWDWGAVGSAAATGRLSRQIRLPRIPTRRALALGYRFGGDTGPATLLSIGARGFSVLELREGGSPVFRENSRCSQGTGNFLRQLFERFSMSVEEADLLAVDVSSPAALSGRCPVILKTDMTHLANKGEDCARIAAGLLDAVCENVMALMRPGVAPRRVVLLGGVSRSARVRTTLTRVLAEHGMTLAVTDGEDGLFVEAVGAALAAAQAPPAQPPPLAQLTRQAQQPSIERLDALRVHLSRVRRMRAPKRGDGRAPDHVLLGLDIGSTGAKAVALDAERDTVLWETYAETGGRPVDAARTLVRRYVDALVPGPAVRAIAVTGSGREIVGSLAATCYGAGAVYVQNEIAAHAEGALHFDPGVDTIFEIGGQDAKYVRLEAGRIVDCAMNQACSAGTGSFIEEQGRRFPGVREVTQVARLAMDADAAVFLGQHCSVFMAEAIDEAVASGAQVPEILAGLFDSVVQNYLDRVKGNRPVGRVVFCQGMPFSSDALAAAVVRHTGADVVVPPSPGTVGAFGIALLARRHIAWETAPALDLGLFLDARVAAKESFVCQATVGCGGSGARCRIDALTTDVAGRRHRHTWGGACALHDRGTRRRKLPDLAPDPFREHEKLLASFLAELGGASGPTIALPAELAVRGLLPFFVTFLRELGFAVRPVASSRQTTLKRGVQASQVPFCAPMQLLHGLVQEMDSCDSDVLMLPMIRSLPPAGGASHAVTCPIVQASPDIVRWSLGQTNGRRLVSPILDFGASGLRSERFRRCCEAMSEELGAGSASPRAMDSAFQAQMEFDRACLELGQAALAFCRERDMPAVVVLGRPYTVHNPVLNSNVPRLLREQGVVGIPVDCYPVGADTTALPEVYWGDAQRILRAARQVRRSPGVYAVYCSNYSCGPDSFNLHFFAQEMEAKPFAIIETDGHSGDAGTQTRIEAFLHCVEGHRKTGGESGAPRRLGLRGLATPELLRDRAIVLVPRLGPASEVFAACLRGAGVPAEALAPPDAAALRSGRRHTSGKECLPLRLTLGSVLQRLESARPGERYTLLMPSTNGPCRFGMYALLQQTILDRLGWGERLRLWSPRDTEYFEGLPPGLAVLLYAGAAASDLLLDARHAVRACATRRCDAESKYRAHFTSLLARVESEARGDLGLANTLWQVAHGRLFGIRDLIGAAVEDLARLRTPGERPTVLVTGEIYLRCDPFSNDGLLDRLESLDLQVRLAGAREWFDYCDHIARTVNGHSPSRLFGRWVRARARRLCHAAAARAMGWPPEADVADVVDAGACYVRPALRGEAILTVGGPLHDWRRGRLDAAVSVGPLECMPNKIAEAQLFHAADREGLLSLTLSANGERLPDEVLEDFAYEVRERWSARLPHDAGTAAGGRSPSRDRRCDGSSGS